MQQRRTVLVEVSADLDDELAHAHDVPRITARSRRSHELHEARHVTRLATLREIEPPRVERATIDPVLPRPRPGRHPCRLRSLQEAACLALVLDLASHRERPWGIGRGESSRRR
jgi:hypothetical protein